MKISISIIGNQEDKQEFYYNEKTLFLRFKSIDDYYNFLKNPSITLLNSNELEYSSEEEQKQLKHIEDYLNNRPNLLIDLTKKSKISILGVTNPNEVDITNLPITPLIVIDLSECNWTDIMPFLSNHQFNPNIKFLDCYNSISPVTQNELLSTYKIISDMAKKIKEKKFSPAEATFYIYDQVRNRKYVKEINETPDVSRDLNKVLNGEKIVCLGFARLFASIANALNIEAECVGWHSNDTSKPGHETIIVYLNDPKYNICGAFAFDPTEDCRHSDDNYHFSTHCHTAFLPLFIQKAYLEKSNLFLDYSSLYGKIINRYQYVEKFIELDSPEKIIKQPLKRLIPAVVEMLNKIGITTTVNNDISIDEIKELINQLDKKYIPKKDLRNIIKTVRTIEAEIDPDTYRCDDESIETTIKNNLNNAIYQKEKQAYQRLLKKLFS